MRWIRFSLTAAAVIVSLAVVAAPGAAAADTNGPTAIGQDSQGVSYVGFATGGMIARYDGTGDALSSWGTPGSGPGELGGIVAISVDPTDNVWVLDTNLQVQEFTASGTFETGFTLPPCATGLTPDPAAYGGLVVTANFVYVAHPCDDTILEYSFAGNEDSVRTLPGRPRGIAVGPVGATADQLFVALPDEQEVLTFDAATFGQNSNEPPLEIAGNPSGVQDKNDSTGDALFVADATNDVIDVFTTNTAGAGYSQYRTLGSPGSGNGMFDDPVAFALHGNDGSQFDTQLFVADDGNNRVESITPDGTTKFTAPALADGSTAVPVNSAAPAISGTPTVGDTLTCSTGSWTGSPESYAYSWADNGTTVSGPTTGVDSYTVQSADAGQSLTCAVTATNDFGPSQASVSAPVTPGAASGAGGSGGPSGPSGPSGSGATPPTPPTGTVAPFVTGDAVPGGTLTCNAGTFAGTPPIADTYAWSRDGTAVAAGQTYTVSLNDLGHSLACTETATNSAGTLSAGSASVTPTAATSTAPLRPVGVTVDHGATYTINPAVTLTIVSPADATAVFVSNNAGFQGARTFPVAGDESYAWTLAPGGNDRLARTIYVRFTAPSVSPLLTVIGTIVLDPIAPTIHSATRIGRVLHIRASDQISGVAKLQYARSRTGQVTTVPYSTTIRLPRHTTARWVRVIDNAGNLSRWHRIASSLPISRPQAP